MSLSAAQANKRLTFSSPNILFACAADKDIKDISKLFKYRFNHVYVTKPGNKKQSNIEAEIQAFKDAEIDFTADADFKTIIKRALKETSERNQVLLVTGSFYLLSEVKKIIDDNTK